MESIADPREYRLRFFEENGFKRQKCRIGGEYFWSLGEHESCQDAPCTEYWFNEIPSRSALSVKEARNLFLSFFEENGHKVIRPRPVVARWRNDLFLTIASIVVFQPHVTSGMVPPPANPLAISQPSIRLEDIDNVGLTIGRHLTSFEMAAHHAFNYPDKTVYWKEKTVELAYRFFTEAMGIPGELITFKESWWEGGGNAGPSFEVAVGGLELATLVFMKYRITDRGYEEIPLKIVDTGYGVERLAWFTAKTPTAFHAIYQGLLEDYRKILGIEEPDKRLLWAAFKAAGRLDPDDPKSVEEYYKRVSKMTDNDLEAVEEVLRREAVLYSMLDHTKTISLMLADGIVPSNTGEGYLARLVIRRALKQLWRIGGEVDLAELVEKQIEFWKDSFPQLEDNRDYVLDAVSHEERRYRETLDKGSSLVRRLLKKKSITLDDLIMLYESHGIPPDLVRVEAEKHGINIEVPHNFYSIVASRHQSPRNLGKKGSEEAVGLPRDVILWADGFPPTRRLFHEDPYLREFNSRIIGVRGRYVILERTAFYPLGGGQYYDTGVLRACNQEYRVEEVYKTSKDVIVHVLDREFCGEAGEVYGVIDWVRRYRMMRHHTGTHVILGAARRVLGSHVWQAGAEKTEFKGRLDITHHKPLTHREVRLIEELANKVVDERRRVKAVVMDRNEAEEKYGFRLYQGGVPQSPHIRVVDIEGWDTQACFGTHLSNTGEIGGLKIVNIERLADGVVRLEYVAGTRIAEEAGRLESIIEGLAGVVGGGKDNLEKRVAKLVRQLQVSEEALEKYRERYAELLEHSIEHLDGYKLLVFKPVEADRRSTQDILRSLTGRHRELVALAVIEAEEGAEVLVALGSGAAEKTSAREIASGLIRILGGKGGGGKTFASIRLEGTVRVEDLARAVRELLENAR